MKQNSVAMLVALVCTGGCLPGRAQILNLEGNYAGTAMFGSSMNSYVEYGAGGIDSAAISGLTTAEFATAGIVGWKDSLPSYFRGNERIGCSLVAPDGSSLRGMCSGEGWTEGEISGPFRIDGGTGRFRGYGGGGLWTSHHIRRIPSFFPLYEVLIHVEGKAEPVPEPTTLALFLLSGCLGTMVQGRRLRRFARSVRTM